MFLYSLKMKMSDDLFLSFAHRDQYGTGEHQNNILIGVVYSCHRAAAVSLCPAAMLRAAATTADAAMLPPTSRCRAVALSHCRHRGPDWRRWHDIIVLGAVHCGLFRITHGWGDALP